MSLAQLPRRALRLPCRSLPIRSLLTSQTSHTSHSTTSTRSSSTTAQPYRHTPSTAYHPPTTSIFTPLDTFLPRHVGPRVSDVDEMLSVLGYKTMDEVVDATSPRGVRVAELSDKDDGKGLRPLSELELRRRAEEVASMNKKMKSYIGMG